MTEFFPQYVSSKLKNRQFRNDDEIYLFLLSIVATFFCFLVHVFLFFLFLVTREWLFAVLNVGSMSIYLFLMFLIPKGKYTLIGTTISLEVIIYSTFASCLSGFATLTLSYLLLVVVMQFVIPYGTPRGRAGVVVLIFFCTTLCLMVDMLCPVFITLSPILMRILMVSNVYILLFGTVVELYIMSLAKQIITHLNEERLEEMTSQANTDALTGLFNRRYAELFFDTLPEAEESYLVAMVDIDDFKKVNDTYGHVAGDEVLAYLANFLLQHLRKTDVVFRWGGEEFVIFLENIDLKTGYRVMDNLREELSRCVIETMVQPIQITVTMGLAQLDPYDPLGSVDISDQKMYYGKTNGKNQVVI